MSIVPIIAKLVREERLMPYQPTVVRAPHPQGPRFLWLAPGVHQWCFPADTHPDTRITDESLAHLGDQFNAFVCGEFMDYKDGVDIRRLRPRERDIWEIRSHLKQPQLRVLGWFALPKLFVGTHNAVRDDLEESDGPKWEKIIDATDQMRTELVGRVDYYHVDGGEYVRNPA
jgi:hypothetical protein